MKNHLQESEKQPMDHNNKNLS